MRFSCLLFLIACGKTTYAQLHLPPQQASSLPAEECAAPPCPIVIADGQQGAFSVAVDANNIYWTTLEGGTVMQAPITTTVDAGGAGSSSSGGGDIANGGVEPITLASGQISPFAIAVNFQAVYWATTAPAGQTTAVATGQGTVNGVIIGNTSATVLSTKQNFPVLDIVAGVSSVFWPYSESSAGKKNGGINAQAGDGTAATNVLSNQPNPKSVALDTKNVYVSLYGEAASDGVVEAVPYSYVSGKLVPSKTPVVLASGVAQPTSLAVDSNNVYWVSPGAIMSAPISPGTPTTLATGGTPYELCIDAKNAYWTDTTAGTVNAVPIAGGSMTVLASSQDTPTGIATDGVHVYWTANSQVLRIDVP